MSTYLEDSYSNSYSPHIIVKPGDVIWTWCSKHMTRTDHLYTGHSLVCLECEPVKADEDEK